MTVSAPVPTAVRLAADSSPVAFVHRAAEARPAPDPVAPPRHLRLVDDFGPVGTDVADLPDAHSWVRRIALPLFEAATGARPTTQVLRYLSPEVYDSVVRRSGRAARHGGARRRPVRLRRAHAAVVPAAPGAPAVVEACAVIDDHQRVRVMALRLEGLDGRWLVTACEMG